MGIWISRLMAVFGEREARILVLGLDNAGKTTILCKQPELSSSMIDLMACWNVTFALKYTILTPADVCYSDGKYYVKQIACKLEKSSRPSQVSS